MDANKERTNIDAVRSLLGQKLPITRDMLEEALRDLEVRYISTIDVRVKAQSELYQKRLQYLHPKDAQYTDMDRKIMLDAHTAEEQAHYEICAATEKALEQRIAVIHTLLGYS